MIIDRQSSVPIYLQIQHILEQAVLSGEYKAGSLLPTEAVLCMQYGISRYPLRQAMAHLVQAGLLERTRGKGTYVRTNKPNQQTDQTAPQPHPIGNWPAAGGKPLIALVIPGLTGDYPRDIANGFLQSAAAQDFSTLVALSRNKDEESRCLERLVRTGVAGLAIFPCDEHIEDILADFQEKGIYIALIDRSFDLPRFDLIASDNIGGGFMAARHLHQCGFKKAAFISDSWPISSVQERLQGFRRGMEQYGLNWLNPLSARQEYASSESSANLDFSSALFMEQLDFYRNQQPWGLFCENDGLALKMMSLLKEQNIIIGRDVGIIGFDNESAGRCSIPGLTTIAQNGWLIGDAAARAVISHLTGEDSPFSRHILPTQIMIRQSCGESGMI
ncbi:MAG: GntR family transcriptional regulator [Clostridiaceae bacterium]|nr:GntR family transcriptional regulator [Clostridiaceae bacterium]